MTRRLKQTLSDTWLFPRFILRRYISAAVQGARERIAGRLLDIGCGRRPYETLLAGRVTTYVGMDWPASNGRATPDVVGDAARLPFLASSFDAVLATEIMEHVSDPDGFLEELQRVMRAGGCLLLSVPFLEPLHEEPRDYFRFTPYSLHMLLGRHGFEVNRISNSGGWWSVVLGSFVNQSMYDFANPMNAAGRRTNDFAAALVLPICAVAQLLGYGLDRLFTTRRYTLGFIVVATRVCDVRHATSAVRESDVERLNRVWK